MSTSAGAIVLFLLLAIGGPAATFGLARLLSSRVVREAHTAPAPLPSWLRVSIEGFHAVLLLALLDVAVLFVVVWAVALHLLDTWYALAEILLFVAVLGGAAAYVAAQGLRRPS